jgi:site-specific DNA-cytosine methylase
MKRSFDFFLNGFRFCYTIGSRNGEGKAEGLVMRSIEICAGAGGQALGLEQAGFEHVALLELDADACATLRLNRPKWNVLEQDIRYFSALEYRGVDLLAGGVPCPPFSVAGKQLGQDDERDLFPEALRLVWECNPKAVMLENVRGIFDRRLGRFFFRKWRAKGGKAPRIGRKKQMESRRP